MRTAFAPVVAALVSCLTLAAAGCAGSVPATESQRRIVDVDGDVFRSTDRGIAARFAAPRAEVWKALLGAYDDLGISAEATDTTVWAVSRTKVRMRNVYKGTRTSRLFSCGETATGQAQADAGQIIANVRSQVTPAASEMRVSTLVDAWLIPDGGTSSNALHCGSTGLLEAQLHKAVATRLGQGAPGE